MKYHISKKSSHSFIAGSGKSHPITSSAFSNAVYETHKIIDQIAGFKVNIFEVLGMRNLSAFIGELFAASLIDVTNGVYKKNPHQDGYPDLLLMDVNGQHIFKDLESKGKLREKEPFSPFPNGGIEVKATCGSVPTPAQCRKKGIDEKPDIGDQRIGLLMGYDWKAHHRETNNLASILWDFIDGVPRIVAVFFCSTLVENDWGKIIQPKDGGGRTTSVSIMTRAGVKKVYDDWVMVYSDDPRYGIFLNKYNKDSKIP